MPSFGNKSLEVKKTLHPVLALLCSNVVKYFDISLLQGLRTKAEQNRLFGCGLSKLQWPDSNHNVDENTPFPQNLSRAVDATPFPVPAGFGDLGSEVPAARDLEWKERVKFYQMVAIFKYEWSRMQEADNSLKRFIFRFGADWDGDGDYRDQTFDDLPHIEINER